MNNFKKWFDNIEESVAGNLAALAGMAMGSGGEQVAGKNPTAMVQSDPMRHGVKVIVNKQEATRLLADVNKVIKNLEFFQRHIAPEIKDVKFFYGASRQVGPKHFALEKYEPETTGADIDPMIAAWLDKYRLFASYKPEQLVQVFSNSKNEKEQESLNNFYSNFRNDVVSRLVKLKDKGQIETLHAFQLKGEDDPRDGEMRGLHNFTARWEDYIGKICALSLKPSNLVLSKMDKVLEMLGN